MNITINIREELQQLNDDWIVLVDSPNELATDVIHQSLDYLVNDQQYVGIVLTANKPYTTLKKMYDEKGINTDKIIFIDCISKSQSSEIQQSGNVIYIDAVYNLTKISLAFKQIIKKINGKKFLYIDSVSSMLIHNNSDIYIRFIHGLITSMRLESTSGLFFTLSQQTDESVKNEIANLCDKTIVVS